jgi:DNA-binding MarR family transcriptional regulator
MRNYSGKVHKPRKMSDTPNGYTIVDNRSLNDERLSWTARGVLAYLLSKPTDWGILMSDLEAKSTQGRLAVRSAIKELEDLGYVKRRQYQDEHGRFKIETEVFWYPEVTGG